MEKLRRKIIGKGFPIFPLEKKKKKNCYFEFSDFVVGEGSMSNLISVLLVFPNKKKKKMGKKGLKKST